MTTEKSMDMGIPETINAVLKDHQRQLSVKDWTVSDKVQTLHRFTEIVISWFKLQLADIPAIAVKRLRLTRLGHYVHGRNDFGLKHELAIDMRHFDTNPFANVLGTLLHELLHFEQTVLGTAGSCKNNYHNKAFRERAASFGLNVDQKGHQLYAAPPTPFSEFLKEHGIDLPCSFAADASPTGTVRQGTSKLKLWVCRCMPKPVHVRVAISDFRARCLVCGEEFMRADMSLGGEIEQQESN